MIKKHKQQIIYIMFEMLRKYISAHAIFSNEEFSKVEQVCIYKKFRKRQYILQEGDINHFVIFICKGCLRTYRVDDRGNEHIISFSKENTWAGDRESPFIGGPSNFNIDALEDTEVILIRNLCYQELCKNLPVFKDMTTRILTKSLIESQHRIHSAISFSAEDKYLDFSEKFPDLTIRVPQHMIASYLGMTPETLSRVRRDTVKGKLTPHQPLI